MYPSRPARFRRGVRYGIAAAAGILLLAAIGLVVEVAMGPHPAGTTQPPPIPDLFGSPGASSAPTSQPPGLLHLIPGRQLQDGVWVGYPHSTAGAVSAADQFASQLASTLDPGRAAAVMRLVADPSYSQGPQQFAQGMASARADLGLPGTGSLPGGTSAVLDPAEYQVRDATPDQMTVLLLSDYVVTTPDSGTQTRILVYPLRMHWADGDWKILAPGNATYPGLAVQPGSPEAASAGWQEVSP